MQADADESMATKLGQEDFDAAIKCVTDAAAEIALLQTLAVRAIGAEAYEGSELQNAVNAALAQLEAQASDVEASRSDFEAVRDVQARAYSWASTIRANNVSIDPGAGRTQSELQQNLSAY